MAKELDKVLAAYAEMWTKLGYPEPRWPLDTAPHWNGSYHCEFGDGKYRWIASDDRGVYCDLMETTREEECLEWIALDLTSALAHTYNKLDKDSPCEELRRERNRRQVALVGILSPEWAARKESQLKRDNPL